MIGIIDSSIEIVTDSLKIWYDAAQLRSYSGTGTTWTDLSGNNNNGTLTNGPTFDSNNGGSIVFDTTDDYTNISSSPLTNYPITLSFWGKTTAGTNFGMAVGESVNNHRFQFGFQGGTFTLGQVTNGLNSLVQGGSYTNGTWTLFTATIQQSARRIYLNSTEVASDTSDAGTTNNWTVNILSGRPRDGSIAFFWGGNIAVAMGYNKVLSSTEITQNYNAVRSRFGV